MSTPKTVFSENDLGELEWALQAVCSALNAAKVSLDEAEKSSLRRRLFLMACNGMNDPEMLCGHLIDSSRA